MSKWGWGETSEAKLRANRKYDEEHTRQYHLKLNMRTDIDIIKWLNWESGERSIQGYIKRLIREDMFKRMKEKQTASPETQAHVPAD
jgi:hypothetical protein